MRLRLRDGARSGNLKIHHIFKIECDGTETAGRVRSTLKWRIFDFPGGDRIPDVLSLVSWLRMDK